VGATATHSPKGRPGPPAVLRAVVVAVQAGPAVRAGMPADGHAFCDQRPAATAGPAGRGRWHGDDLLPGTRCLASEEAQDLRPARVRDGGGELLIRERVGRLHICVRDRGVVTHKRERSPVVEVLALPPHLLLPSGEHLHCFASADAAPLASAHPSLGLLQVALGFAVVTRSIDGVPSASVAKAPRPRSIKVYAGLLTGERFWHDRHVGTSAQEKHPYQPSASRDVVTALGVPSVGRDQRTALRPILLSTRKPVSKRISKRAPPCSPTCGAVKL
jgi:hypothetical protein